LQDRIFSYFDKRLFPHKHLKSVREGLKETEYGILALLGTILLLILQGVFVPSLSGIFATLAPVLVVTSIIIIFYGEFKLFQSKTQ
jgi:hypothetical protein